MAKTADLTAVEPIAKPRVLLADDSKLVRKTADKILSESFDLIMVEDGQQALEAIQADESIQVVFTDLGMPNLDGYGLIEKLRQSDNDRVRDLPIIVITGAAEEESVKQKVFELGATDFITKPFKSTEVIARAEAHASYRTSKDQLQKNTNIDVLTGTLNKQGLLEKLEKDVSFVNRHNQNLALIIFELDNFKAIAAKIKLQGAEKIIQQTAKLLGNAIRKEDSFGRYEFSKFITILPMAKTEGIVRLAKRLCDHIGSFKINVGGEKLALSMSVGIAAVAKGNHATSEGLLDTAEKALANANAVGPGEVQILKLEGVAPKKAPARISIDSLLENISRDQKEISNEEMRAAVNMLEPLIALMTDMQKQKLLK